MKKEKKPDLVVWDEVRGYYAKELAYPSNVGAPAIRIDDVKGWRSREVTNVNHKFEAKYAELKEEFQKLLEEYDLNQFIYSKVEYNFLPVIGQYYFLYQRDDGSFFLSLIEPNQWKRKFIYEVHLDSNNTWNKIN
jgi:hypothetical protein